MKLPRIPDEASVHGEDNLPLIPVPLIGNIRITVDGRDAGGVVSYSMPRGFLRMVVHDRRGSLVARGPIDDPEIVTVRIEGAVVVEMIDHPTM